MSFALKLDKIVERYEELNVLLLDPSAMSGNNFIIASKEYSDLTPIVQKINYLRQLEAEMRDLTHLLSDKDIDDDFKNMAETEHTNLKLQIPEVEHSIKLLLLPQDEADEKNAILEVRAGTGGEEASLFACELFHMYQRYAEKQRWKFEILSVSDTGVGGYKEASASISGKNVFSRLKFESGVHRVQRVPSTESQGRIHTSAATVAVLPEAEEVDIAIDDKDLRIDVYRASGAGGQHVNTTESAVRIVHIPTGLIVTQQDEKSQHKNKAKALKILRARLYDHQRSARDAVLAAQRKTQVGSGDRSERIRTYNFPQGRVTDHRINLTLYKIEAILTEGDLDSFIDTLISEDQVSRLSQTEL